MNDLYKVCCQILLIMLLGCFAGDRLVAQGPPVMMMDTCLVSNTQRFKSLPIPGEFVPGAYEDLRACPSLGNNVVKLPNVKVAKAHHLQMWLRIEGGKLVQMEASTMGVKNFENLYEQVVLQAGTPSKMVESQAILSYSWDLRTKLVAKMAFTYDPVKEHAIIVITP
jgi:hypothetical protein